MKLWTVAFADAWNALSNVAFPTDVEASGEDDLSDERFLACFPLVWAAWGFGGAVAAWMISTLLPLSLAASAVSAIIIVLAWEFISAAGNVSSLTGYLQRILERRGMRAEGSNDMLGFEVSGATLFISLYLLKIVCVGAVVYSGRFSWLVVAMALGGLVRARLAADDSSGKAVIPVEEGGAAARMSWGAAVAVVIAAGIWYLPAVSLALLAAWGITAVGGKTIRSAPAGTANTAIDALGAAADILFLLAGAALLVGR